MNEPARKSFKAQMHQVREDAIVQAVIRLLCEKGYDAMTVDEVAASVGIAKASLYKHFEGKEQLAAAALRQVVQRAREFLCIVPADITPHDKLKAVLGWALSLQMANELPALPTRNSSLWNALVADRPTLDGVAELSGRLGEWIAQAQSAGQIDPALPLQVVLYTLCARASDPAVAWLRQSGQYSQAQIVELALRLCFDGLNARA